MMSKALKQFLPFYFYTLVAVGLGVAATASSEARPVSGVLLLLVIGFFSWGLVEYVLHRFAFHFEARSEKGRELIYAMHLSHHEDPKALDQLFASLRMSLPFAVIYALLAWAVTWSWQSASYLFIGLVAGYFSYEFLHYQAHHRAPRSRVFRYLKKYHMLHHHQTPDLRFGVTSPFVDYLFGTFRSVGKPASRV